MAAQLRARLCRLPEGATFSHATAALLWGLPLPLRLSWDGSVHITTPPGTRARRGRGVTGYQRNLPPTDQVRLGDVPCTGLIRTFCDLAEVLTLAELVAVGDALISPAGKATPLEEIVAGIERPRTTRTKLRSAVALLDAASESPKESELRVLLIQHGIAGLACQVEVRDENGFFVGRVDLAISHLKIAVEYEGDHHREKGQWRRDQRRRRALEALGWVYIHVTQADLDDPRQLLADLRVAIRRQTSR